jgi:hypothetical protein
MGRTDCPVLTTWQPPAVPPATTSQNGDIRPVSGSIALPRTGSLTVSLIAFPVPHPKKTVKPRVCTAKKVRVYNQLRSKTTVKAPEAFIAEHLLDAVQAVLVQKLPDNSAALILHSSSREVNKLGPGDSIRTHRV